MNELINGSSAKSEQTISSKEIATLTNKDHSNVLRDIRVMLYELKKEDSNLNSNDYQVLNLPNGMTSEILLNQNLSLCLALVYLKCKNVLI